MFIQSIQKMFQHLGNLNHREKKKNFSLFISENRFHARQAFDNCVTKCVEVDLFPNCSMLIAYDSEIPRISCSIRTIWEILPIDQWPSILQECRRICAEKDADDYFLKFLQLKNFLWKKEDQKFFLNFEFRQKEKLKKNIIEGISVCETWQYKIKFESSIATVLGNKKNQRLQHEIQITPFDIISIEETSADTIDKLLSDIGGALGLFLGASVLTMVQILILCGKLCCLVSTKENRRPNAETCKIFPSQHQKEIMVTKF